MSRQTAILVAIISALGSSTHLARSQSAKAVVANDSRTPAADRLTYTTFQRPSNWDIYQFERSGQAPRRMTTDPGLDYGPVVSADGRWLVFASERRGNPDLYVVDLQTSGSEPRLLIDSDALEDQASFSPDSRSLAFVSTLSGNAEIYQLPFEPGRTQRMTDAQNLTRHTAGDFRPAFSPDGRKVAFSSDRDLAVRAITPINRERSSDIYVLDLVTRSLQRLTDTPGWDGSPKWSADGSQIVFYSQRGTDLNGRVRESKIWMMASDGANQRVVTATESVAVSPEFLANGRIIYSRRTAAGRWEIASVERDGSDVRVESDASAGDYGAPTKGPASGTFVVHGDGPVAGDPPGGYRRSVGETVLFSRGPVLVAGAPFRRTLPDREIEIFPLRYFAAVLHPAEDLLLHLRAASTTLRQPRFAFSEATPRG
jgi:dipeptidyl aminopeptidase/acylaminoacyl peptidase